MKKIFLAMCFIFSIYINSVSFATSDIYFPLALKTCENYSNQGGVEYNKDYFNILITLEKTKSKKCLYKEKIYQGKNYQMLNCEFEIWQLEKLSKIMEEYNNAYKKEISKNKIYEAKLTASGEIFENYLIDPKYCKITHSKE